MQESEFTEIQLLLKLLTLYYIRGPQGFDLQIFHKLKVRLLAMLWQCSAMLGNVLAMFGNVCYNTYRETDNEN